LVAAALERLGRIDILHNNVGASLALGDAPATELTENLAAANAPYGVRANAILPGLMNTPTAIEARVARGTSREEVIASRDRRVPLRRRMGTGWDVAYAALFLHSDEAGFVTGVSLAVDGGEGVSWGS
jgi:NAD(P)-dependent dehydrogenase (short-subunit alcohol dehydrogenase family)